MARSSQEPVTEAVFRIDRFVVPQKSETLFMERVQHIQSALDGLPQCAQNLVLTHLNPSGEMNVVTLVEWANAEAMAAASTRMKVRYVEENFDPQSFMKALGVKPDFGIFKRYNKTSL